MLFPNRSRVSSVVALSYTFKVQNILLPPLAFWLVEQAGSLSPHSDIRCLCRNTFLFCRKEFTRSLIIARDSTDKYILGTVRSCIFPHFYCCSSACPCITLRNGTVCTVKWKHILHVQREHCGLKTIT